MPDATMFRPARSHAGSSSRDVLLLLALAGAILAVLALVLKSARPTPSDVALTGPGAALRKSSDSGLSSGPDTHAPALESGDGSASRAGGVPVGVRLSAQGRLEGRVIERETGAGAADVRVDLLPVPPAAGSILGRLLRAASPSSGLAERVRPIATAATGPDGVFSFRGVRQGTWYVEARGPYHAPESAVRARVLPSGSGGPLDVWVKAGGRVLGKVLAPDGSAAAGAKLAFVGGPGRFLTDALSGDLRLAEATSDADGAFTFDGIPPGEGYEISAAGDGFAVSHCIGIAVRAGADIEVVVKTRLGGMVAGHVFSGAGESGPIPLAGAHVGAIPRGLRDLRLAEEMLLATHCVTAADGSFTMRKVPPGEIDLAAIAEQHLPGIGVHVAIVDGALAAAPDIVLARGPMISGRVVDAAGAPVAGVQVRWSPVDWKKLGGGDFSFAPALAQSVKGFAWPTSAEDGRFTAGPCAGEPPWPVDFEKTGWQAAQASFEAKQVGGEVSVVLHRGGTVEGRVADGTTSEPVAAFTISSTDRIDVEEEAPGSKNPFSGGQLFEDAHGGFRLEAVAPGEAKLSFSARGYLDQTVTVAVVEGQATKDLDVKLRRGGSVKGLVVDADSRPVCGAQVFPADEKGKVRNTPIERMRTARRSEAGQRSPLSMLGGGDLPPGLLGYAASLGLLGDKAILSDTQGGFEITGLEPGTLTFRAVHHEFAWGVSEPVAVVEGGALAGVRVVMHAGGGIEGHVTDRHGQPVAREIVVALSPAAFEGKSGKGGLVEGETDAQGAYRILHVSPGSYFLLATRGDEALNPMSFMGRMNFDLVTVPEGRAVTYDLVDRSAGGCRVYGTVSDEGKPLSHGNLVAVGYEGGGMLGLEVKAARIGSEGSFEYPGLAPGRYQLSVEDADARARMVIDVPDQPELFVALEIPVGGVEGTVIDEAGGGPVEGAEIRLRALDEPEARGFVARMVSREGRASRTATDAAGRFEFIRLRGAEYELTVRPPRVGATPGDAAKKTRFAPPPSRTIRVDERRVERGIEVRLSPALSLSGVVKDEGGGPVKGARVGVRPQQGEGGPFERVWTDDAGHFEIGGLPPGVYVATATSREYAGASVRDVKVERGVERSGGIEIRLSKGVKVGVRVVGPDGAPAQGAHAILTVEREGSDLDGVDMERTLQGMFSGEGAADSEGRIDLGRFAPGEYRLEVQRGGSKTTLPHVKIEGGRAEIELRAELP
jgi:hypothetical protein